MYELNKNQMVPRNVLFAASRGWRRKREATFAVSWEYVTVQMLKRLKCAVVCYFNGRILLPRTYYTVSKNYARSFFS